MTPVPKHTRFTRAREEIAEAVEAGAELEQLETELLDHVALSRDTRDALWLYAWGTIERRERHRPAPRWRRATPDRASAHRHRRNPAAGPRGSRRSKADET